MDKRVKYSIKQKGAAVRSILKGEASIRSTSRELGCAKSAVQRWVTQYNQQGIGGLKIKNGAYEAAFKLRVVRYYLQKGLSLNAIARHFEIPNEGIISRWVNSYKRLGAKGLSPKSRGRKKTIMSSKPRKKTNTPTDPSTQKLAEMQKELEYLRAENAFLKKLNALVQQEEAAKAQARRPKSSGN
jgi:transposase